MPPLAIRIFSAFIAILVFVGNISCACGGMDFGSDARADAFEEHCPHDADHDSDQPCHQHDSSCQHCQPSAVSAEQASKNFALHLDFSEFTPRFIDAVPVLNNSFVFHTRCGMPPPDGPPTLLSLHCALNT